jgi:drug/metabolite transporter (DMT)-like permease
MKLDAWVQWVLLAGLSWGTYVPLIFYGGQELGGKPASRILAILCVGVAYFLIAVLFPLYLFFSGQEQWPDWSTTGLVFSGLAGVAGAIGALCVVFASKAAVDAAKAANLPPGTFRLYIAPLIFGLAPVINTVVSLLWHPKVGSPFHFGVEHLPGWKLWLGIVLVGAGAFLVLYAKEESETHKPAVAVGEPRP